VQASHLTYSNPWTLCSFFRRVIGNFRPILRLKTEGHIANRAGVDRISVSLGAFLIDPFQIG